MNMGKVLVIGASPNPKRHSYNAVRKLLLHHHEVIPIGKHDGNIGTCPIIIDKPVYRNVDLIILYINSERQREYYNYILQLKPRRILFNPGTENPELAQIAVENKIEIIYDCALKLINSRILKL